MVSLPRRVLPALYVLVIIIGSGIAGYMVIERWSFIDALYMTILTITTVGYGEVHTLSQGGRVFSVVLMIGGAAGAVDEDRQAEPAPGADQAIGLGRGGEDGVDIRLEAAAPAIRPGLWVTRSPTAARCSG